MGGFALFPTFVAVSGDGCELQARSPCKNQMLPEFGQPRIRWLKSPSVRGSVAGGIRVALPSIRGFLVTAGRYSPTCHDVVLLRSVLQAADISVLKCSGSRPILPASTAPHRQPQQTLLYPTHIQAECGFCACEESVGPRRWEANG